MVSVECFSSFFSLIQIEAFPFKCLSSQSNVRCTAVAPIVPNISCADKYDGKSTLAHPYFGKPLTKPSTRASAANHNGQMASLFQLPHYVHSKITNIHEKCTQALFLHYYTITRTARYFLLTDLSIIKRTPPSLQLHNHRTRQWLSWQHAITPCTTNLACYS